MSPPGNEKPGKTSSSAGEVNRENKKDQHFPSFTLDIPLRKLFDSPQKYNPVLTRGQVVADLGCDPGYFTLALAECVGPEGRSTRSIRTLRRSRRWKKRS